MENMNFIRKLFNRPRKWHYLVNVPDDVLVESENRVYKYNARGYRDAYAYNETLARYVYVSENSYFRGPYTEFTGEFDCLYTR